MGVVALAIALPGAAPRQDAALEALRPRFHFTPARNFMNDPNGLVFYKGEYHLFYQHNPFGQVWGHMSWGHAVSRDMLQWEHLPVALREEDGVMIFSGSAVVDWNNTSGFCVPVGQDRSCLVAIYTGHSPGKQTQNLAFSNDRGRTWTKYASNPVVDLGLSDFRDPKVFWHAPTSRWVMVTVLATQHKVRLFASPDLKRWETLSDFGPAGATGGVWECPDLFPLPVDGNAERPALGPRRGHQPWRRGRRIRRAVLRRVVRRHAVRQREPAGHDAVGRLRQGLLREPCRSPTSRRPMAAGSGWRGSATGSTPTRSRRSIWRGAQSVPRELALRRLPDGIRLVQRPVAELRSLRASADPVAVVEPMALPESAEIELEFERGSWSQAGIRLSNQAGEEVIVGVTSNPPEVFVDRRKSRLTPVHREYPGRHAGPVRWRDGRLSLRVLFDRSVVEVFANDGETVVTDRVFPTQPLDRIAPLEQGRPRLARMWALRAQP